MAPEKKAYTWICTMLSSVDFCQLPGRYGSFKWPQLQELHKILFGKEFDSAHDALADVVACGDCLFELIKRDVITLHQEL
jgi:DNA polymerase III epsilon subunit-like protein